MFKTELEQEIFRKTIRELTFCPCITSTVLFDSISETNIGIKEFDLLKDNTEYVNETKRGKRLLKTLLDCNSSVDLPVSELTTMPKIYDNILNSKRISLYNYMADRLDYPKIDSAAPSVEKLKQIANINSSHPNYETIIKYYPHYNTEDRKGFDFIEYILLLNVSLTTHHRTLTLFQKLLKTPNNDIQIDRWIDTVQASIYSPSLYRSYIDTFFSNFRYIVAKKYNQVVHILRDDYDQPESRNPDIYYYSYCDAENLLPDVIKIHNETIPTAWRLINCEDIYNPYRLSDENWLNKIDDETKSEAQTYIAEAKEYINQAMKEAEAILPTFFAKE